MWTVGLLMLFRLESLQALLGAYHAVPNKLLDPKIEFYGYFLNIVREGCLGGGGFLKWEVGIRKSEVGSRLKGCKGWKRVRVSHTLRQINITTNTF